MTMSTSTFEQAKQLFRDYGGLLKTSEALRIGIHPRILYAMRDANIIETLSRGLYRLRDLPPLSCPDLTVVAVKVPKGVLCLISALAYHDLTSQIPHVIYLALPSGAEPPRLAYPPLRLVWFSGDAFTYGIEAHSVDGVELRVYSPEKTLADCFKFRNKIGLDVALEALKLYRARPSFSIDALMQAARICRVERIMRPYVEALL